LRERGGNPKEIGPVSSDADGTRLALATSDLWAREKRMIIQSATRAATAVIFFCAIAQAASEEPTDLSREFGDEEYRLGPEDVVDVFVWKEPDLTTTAVIRPDGFISLPLVNETLASGKTVVELQNDIKERLSEFLSEPVVSVILKEINSPRITVLGEVRDPNVYKIGQKSTVFDAIAMAGGFTEFAARSEVTVIRNGVTGVRRIQLDLRELVKGPGEIFYLRPSDTVYVR
jgi:polysaccharide export outer membrane protein